MYNKVECVMLECDRCKTHFEDGFTGFSIFSDESDIGERAREGGWYMFSDDGKHYCQDCFIVDEEDSIIIKT